MSKSSSVAPCERAALAQHRHVTVHGHHVSLHPIHRVKFYRQLA
jgi:hypothetical protein